MHVFIYELFSSILPDYNAKQSEINAHPRHHDNSDPAV